LLESQQTPPSLDLNLPTHLNAHFRDVNISGPLKEK